MVNVGVLDAVPSCIGVTTMGKERRQDIHLTDEETGRNDLLRDAAVDPNRRVARG